MMTAMSDEAYWSIPFVAVPLLALAFMACCDAWPRSRDRLQRALDRALGQEQPPAHLKQPEATLYVETARYVRTDRGVELHTSFGGWRQPLSHVTTLVAKPYDWQVDGDA